MSSTEADGLRALMDTQHKQNRGDIDDLKDGQATLTATVNILSSTLTNLVGEISGATRVLRFLAWIVMALIAGLSVWFASLEVRGKVADNKPPVGVSSYQTPQESTAPYAPR